MNKALRRAAHPFPSAADILRQLKPSSRFFAKLDAVHGYYQLRLEEESSYLTTFILPSGRYKYNCLPMGMKTASDDFCRETDYLVVDVDWAHKIIDDLLIQAATEHELWQRLHLILERCRTKGIVLSKDKLVAGNSIKFAGFVISVQGVFPDPDKTAAIRDFPTPKTRTDLKSFMGMAAQLGNFLPDFAHITQELRHLVSVRNAFLWLPEHQAEFENAKLLLCGQQVVKPFAPELKTELLTDASRLFGVGYALVQIAPKGHLQLVQCG